jgi:YfiH family protein
VALMTQVHGATVLRVDAPTGPLDTVGSCDGCITAQPGLVLAVRTADCVPVLFAGRGGVGVAHAGWRGVALGVVPATALALAELLGCSPADLVATIGPHIQAPAYETGPGVVEALVGAGIPREVVAVEGAHRLHADLGGAVRWQLERLGVEHDSLGLCTATDPRFFSHRRDGADTGRLAGLVGLAP